MTLGYHLDNIWHHVGARGPAASRARRQAAGRGRVRGVAPPAVVENAITDDGMITDDGRAA